MSELGLANLFDDLIDNRSPAKNRLLESTLAGAVEGKLNLNAPPKKKKISKKITHRPVPTKILVVVARAVTCEPTFFFLAGLSLGLSLRLFVLL